MDGSSSKGRGRKPKAVEEPMVLRTSLRTPRTSTLKSPIATPVKTTTKKTVIKSSQKSSKKAGTVKKGLYKIDEKEESEASESGNFDEDTRDDDEGLRKNEMDIKIEIGNYKKAPKHTKEVIRPNKSDKFHQVLDKFDDAILNLQEYTLPDKIPCREDEKQMIKDFINV